MSNFLDNYDLIIINSSGGKDSLCAIWEVSRIVEEQNFPKENVVVSHQDLGRMEWPGVKELAAEQAAHFGFNIEYSKRRNFEGYEETLLEYAKRRGKWPSNKQRWCTSDFKRSPGARVVTRLTKGRGKCKVLYVFGFRWCESPARAKKKELVLNKRLSTRKRTVYDWCPILHWTDNKVWTTIHDNKLPYHKAYDLGMPRLSCVFCIFSPKDALVLAGKHNPELLEEYVQIEEEINHSFRENLSLKEIQQLINSGYEPKVIPNWTM